MTPAAAIGISQAPFALEKTLWPRIVIAVGSVNDAHTCFGRDRFLKKHASGKRFIVRMWCDHHHARARIEERGVHGGVR
jgi:hypothetical protein